MRVTMLEGPSGYDWVAVKRRALVTVGLNPKTEPTPEWKHAILEARHSPIRRLRFSFYLEGVPTWVSVHLCRHVHAQPYVKSQRNDRQNAYDRNEAPQDAPVNMIWDLNAEELMVVANKRLCGQAAPETREVVRQMCAIVEDHFPEFHGLLVPACDYNGGVCHEIHSCGRCKK